MAFQPIIQQGYHHTVGEFVVELLASESSVYGSSEMLVSIHSVDVPVILHHLYVWNGLPMSLWRCNGILRDAGIPAVVRHQVANHILRDFTSTWFAQDDDFIEYGLCPNITINLYYISNPSSDSSSDSSDSDMEVDMEVDYPHNPATEAAIDGLQELYLLELDGQACSICLDPMLDSMPVLGMPCSHFFHPNCIREWLRVEGSCPLCRFAL